MTVKDECFKCGYFNPNMGKFYKCNTARCPSRHMDLEERKQCIEEKEYDKIGWIQEAQKCKRN